MLKSAKYVQRLSPYQFSPVWVIVSSCLVLHVEDNRQGSNFGEHICHKFFTLYWGTLVCLISWHVRDFELFLCPWRWLPWDLSFCWGDRQKVRCKNVPCTGSARHLWDKIVVHKRNLHSLFQGWPEKSHVKHGSESFLFSVNHISLLMIFQKMQDRFRSNLFRWSRPFAIFHSLCTIVCVARTPMLGIPLIPSCICSLVYWFVKYMFIALCTSIILIGLVWICLLAPLLSTLTVLKRGSF